jgi:surfactin synthase thioesterase subunit
MRFGPKQAKRMRLFCFPYAGGSAGLFESWADAFEDAEVLAVQLPGRSNRIDETPLESVAEIVSSLLGALDDLLDRPFVFFGHSNGALLCFELARELQRRDITGLAHIILSAKSALHLPRTQPNTHDLPYDRFIEELRSINGTPEEFLRNPQLMQLFVPMIRADFKVDETHRYDADVRLKCSASLFAGEMDVDISQADVLAWRDLFDSDDLVYTAFPGDHFFIHSHRQLVLAEIDAVLKRLRGELDAHCGIDKAARA